MRETQPWPLGGQWQPHRFGRGLVGTEGRGGDRHGGRVQGAAGVGFPPGCGEAEQQPGVVTGPAGRSPPSVGPSNTAAPRLSNAVASSAPLRAAVTPTRGSGTSRSSRPSPARMPHRLSARPSPP
jgi:hypothetical protein